jgi:glycogen debranching enzyme
MAIEVSVGPQLVTINRGDTFVLAEPDGSIRPGTDQGIYSRDTRYVSNYEIFADGEHLVLQNSGAVAYYASRTYLTNPRIVTEYGEIVQGTLSLILDRAVSDGIHEDIDIHNYGTRRVRFSLELSLRTDFADIFEVKSKRFVRKGNVTTEWHSENAELINSYQHNGFKRSVITRLARRGSAANYSKWTDQLSSGSSPGGSWHTCCQHTFVGAEKSAGAPTLCVHKLREEQRPIERELTNWKKVTTSVTTSNEDVYRALTVSV